MSAVKRNHEEMTDNPGPYMTMFEVFRQEIDENHMARERIIKASRDVTALSKKASVEGKCNSSI
jgi:hypothetical protein